MQTQRKIYNATYTSIALKREDYEDISKLSKKIIRGVNLTIPQTIRLLVKDGLTRSKLNNKDLIFNYECNRDSNKLNHFFVAEKGYSATPKNTKS